jgi:hypothetical protein
MRSNSILAALAVFSVMMVGTAHAADLPVFVFAGQSNAVGYNYIGDLSPAQRAPQPNVLFYGPNENGSTWGSLTPSLTSPNAGAGFGAEISTGLTISNARGGALVAEVKYAVEGTNLYSDWNPAGTNNQYDNMVARVNQSLAAMPTQLGHTGHVAGFFWMQGEADAMSDAFRNDYAANLTNFIASVRTEFGDPNLPFVFGQIIDFNPPKSSDIRAQQQAVANTVPNTAFILTDDLGHTDFIHFGDQGIYNLGKRFGDAYLTIVPEPSSVVVLGAGALGLLARRDRRGRRGQ